MLKCCQGEKGKYTLHNLNSETYHILIGLAKESVGEHADDKNIYNQWNQQSYTWLNKVVHVGLLDRMLITSVDFARLAVWQTWKETKDAISVDRPRQPLKFFRISKFSELKL